MSKFTDGIKQGIGRAIGVGIVVAVVGLCVAGPAGALEGFKIGVGAGAIGSN